MRQYVILGASAVAVGYIAWRWGFPGAVEIVTGWVANTFERGHRLSSSTLVGGVVQESPAELAAAAADVLGFTPDPDTLALARMGRSEGVDGQEYRMHVALNDLDHLQATYGSGVYSSILALMTHSKIARVDGHFSVQDGTGKRYGTSHDPYEGDYALAQKVLADRAQGFDPTGGALKFVDKDGISSFPDLVASWAKEGLTPAPPLEGASDNFVTFIPA